MALVEQKLRTIMAVVVFLFVLQLTGQVFSQCFTSTDCTGSQVTAVDQRTCCVETSDGLSYNDGSTCNICIGTGSVNLTFYLYNIVSFFQFMAFFRESTVCKRVTDWTLPFK